MAILTCFFLTHFQVVLQLLFIFHYLFFKDFLCVTLLSFKSHSQQNSAKNKQVRNEWTGLHWQIRKFFDFSQNYFHFLVDSYTDVLCCICLLPSHLLLSFLLSLILFFLFFFFQQAFLCTFYVRGHILGDGNLKMSKHCGCCELIVQQETGSVNRSLQNLHSQNLCQKLSHSSLTTTCSVPGSSWYQMERRERHGHSLLLVLLVWVAHSTQSLPLQHTHTHIHTTPRKGPRLEVKRAGLQSKLCALSWNVNLLMKYNAEVTEQLALRMET